MATVRDRGWGKKSEVSRKKSGKFIASYVNRTSLAPFIQIE